MFFVGRQSDLQNSISRMNVPVFAVERDGDGEFRLVAANMAHAKATGLSTALVIGKTPHMILPDEADAELLVSRYKACIHRGTPIAYSSEITYTENLKAVDTILHPISFDGAAPTRVVGQLTVCDVAIKGCADRDRLARIDVQSLRSVLEDMLAHRIIRSSDVMILGTLMKACNLSPTEVASMADVYNAAST